MTRDLAKLNLDVVFGRSGGRVIWQPRIGCWLTDKQFAGEELPERYRGMDLPAIYRDLGCSARLYEFNGCFRRIEHPGVRWSRKELNDTDTENGLVPGPMIHLGERVRLPKVLVEIEAADVVAWVVVDHPQIRLQDGVLLDETGLEPELVADGFETLCPAFR